MFKKRTAPSGQNRPKVRREDLDDDEDDTVVIKPDGPKRKGPVEEDESGAASSSGSSSSSSSSSSNSSSSSSSGGAVAAAVTKVFESSREVVPQSYAGDATHTAEVDNSTKAAGNKYTGYVCASLSIWHLECSILLF